MINRNILIFITIALIIISQKIVIANPKNENILNNAQISTVMQACKYAEKEYTSRSGYLLHATEGAFHAEIIIMGFDMKNFANKGDKIWEVKIHDFYNKNLMSIFLINPYTKNVLYMFGPWLNKY